MKAISPEKVEKTLIVTWRASDKKINWLTEDARNVRRGWMVSDYRAIEHE